MEPRLMRSTDERMIAGVCGGLATYLGIDPVLVRLAFLLLIPAGGIGVPLYIILTIVMPSESDVDLSQSEIFEKNIHELGETVTTSVDRARRHPDGPRIAAVILIVMGVYFLLENLGFVSGGLFWPMALIFLGVFLLVRRNR